MTNSTQESYRPGDRVMMRFDGGGAITGTVVSPPREWKTQLGTPVVYDGDDHVSHSMTSRLVSLEQD